jgi:hypothetical protein
MMESLQDSYLKQSVKAMDQFANYFKYFREELQPIRDVYANFAQIAEKYKTKEAKLYAKKDRLFGEANLKAWDVSLDDLKKYNPQQLASNKDLALTIILPKETKELEENYKQYGYYMNKLIEETKRMTVKNYRRMRRHLQAVSHDHSIVLSGVSQNIA